MRVFVALNLPDTVRQALWTTTSRLRDAAFPVKWVRPFRRPRVVWAGIAPDPALELLQHGVEREFGPLGFPPEGRAFRPHLTLGRAGREARARDFEGLEGALGALRFEETVLVETLDLMRSTLERGGAVYQVIHRERLS